MSGKELAAGLRLTDCALMSFNFRAAANVEGFEESLDKPIWVNNKAR